MDEFSKLTKPNNKLVVNPAGHNDMAQRLSMRAKIEELEAAIYRDTPKEDIMEIHDERWDLQHHFIEGVYARELVIPANMVVIGLLHKFPRICIISGGDVSFVTEFGSKRVQAPYTEVMPPGTKTAVLAHTDTTWTAIHGTHETDISKLEQIFTARNHEELTHEERRRLT